MSEIEDALGWLQRWYEQMCDGDWEHGKNVRIGTIDNPGWSLKINLADTNLEGLPFSPVKIDRTERDWVFAVVEDNEFRAHGGPLNLTEMIDVFRRWAAPIVPRWLWEKTAQPG